ncbi:MAG TPA: hypothetical protein DCG49_05295 [Ruminococcus sp.]|nr:hypothetical protein [Ruminococcus sp.]
MKKRFGVFLLALLCCAPLTACSSGSQTAAASSQEDVRCPLPEQVPDLSFFQEPVTDAPAETGIPENPLYQTQITSANGVVLAEIQEGHWKLTEDGLRYEGLMNSITPDAVVGPEIKNVLRLNTEKMDACARILQDAGIEGCAIVTDPKGQVDMICNNPPDQNYAAMPNFNGSTAKLFVSTAILDHGVQQDYDDPGFFDPGWHRYYNHDTTVPYPSPIRRDLLNAFTVSSNAYFMHAACELLSHEDLLATYNRYYAYNLFGRADTGYYYPADWMRIPQPKWNTIQDNQFERGKSAIGMSDQVMITPLYLNAVTNAIASDGLYQLNLMQDSPVRKINEAEPLSDEMRSKMWELMDSCAKWTNQTVFSSINGYHVYIKTGTADTHYGEQNEHYLKRLLITGFLTKDGQPVKTITLYCHNGAESAFGGNSGMAAYYKQIAELLLQ